MIELENFITMTDKKYIKKCAAVRRKGTRFKVLILFTRDESLNILQLKSPTTTTKEDTKDNSSIAVKTGVLSQLFLGLYTEPSKILFLLHNTSINT